MKSHQRLYGTIFLACLLSSCTTAHHAKDSPAAETSLISDKTEIEELRKNIPPAVRERNDEEALWLKWMGPTKKDPQEVRSVYSEFTRKQRAKQRDKIQKIRDDFGKKERKLRDDHLAHARDKREKFLAQSKHFSSDEKKHFFEDLEDQRKVFFTEQYDKRKEFEAEMSEKTKDFEARQKDKQTEFEARIKDYTIRYNIMKKEQADEKLKPVRSSKPTGEFQEMEAIPGTRLAPTEE